MTHKKFFHRLFIAAALLFLISSFQLGFSQSVLMEKVEPTSNALIIPYQKWKLPNGLTVIIHEDHSDPIVHVQVAYHVGSARESIGKSGFAHFFEHMMFEGSTHVKDKEHFKIINEAGGTMNGYTQEDKTVYFETIPSNYLEVALWLESDRMGFLLDSVTQQKFEIQRSTVKNEKGESDENRPYGLVQEILCQTLYPQGHPYSWPVIGYVDDLNRATLDDLKSFFLRWYGPNNAILTVSGDVDSKTVLTLTEKYFGAINPSPEVKKLRVPLPVLPADKYASYIDNVYLPMILMAFPTVPAYHRDEAALGILADIMGNGNNSVFYKNFIKTEQAEASVGYGTNELSGGFYIQVLPYPNADMADVGKVFNETEKKIRATLDEFEKTGITEDAMQRTKARIESQVVGAMASVAGKAGMLSDWQMLLGRNYNLSDELDRYNKVTKEDLERVFNKYIKGKYAAIINVYPKDPMSKDSVKSVNPNANITLTENPEYAGLKYVKAKDSFDRSKKPAPSEPKAPIVPLFYSHQLKNGLKITGTQTSDIPKVALLMEIEGGDLFFANDLKQVGLASLTADIMNEGSQHYTTEQFSAELDKLGSSISFSAGTQNTSIYMECLTKNIDATLKLLEEKLFKPRFDANDFKRIKKQNIEGMESQKKEASVTASKLYAKLLYGNTLFGTSPTSKSIKKFSLEDVKNYEQQYYSPSVTKLVIAGDISEKDALSKLDFLNNWQSKEVKIPEITVSSTVLQTQIYLSHKDNAAQSVIMLGHLGLPYDATGEFFKANIMNYPLGSSFNSRLNLDLRETKAYTYGISSYFSGGKYPGTFTVSSSVKRTATDASIVAIMKNVTDFKNNGLTDDEVSSTKSSWLNSDALRYETLNQKASFLMKIMRYNLSKDFTTAQAQILKNIAKPELNELAKKYIHPDKMVIVVVGNKFLIKDKLEKLGYGKVKEMEVE